MVDGVGEVETFGFFPADHAEVIGGKVYANGAFWTLLRFPTYPQVIPTVSLVTVLSVPPYEFGRDHAMVIGMMDADGGELPLRAEGTFRVDPGVELRAGESAVVPIAITVTGLRLERAGEYAFRLFVDGDELDRYGFRASQVDPPSVRRDPLV
ncbi:MAG TPA: hypothetical protein VFF40_13730 [Acidimicrobiia bacterium]|nr:hypothetical protein [Acidimicrobiia bacterium]